MKGNLVSRTLYRSVLREIRALTRQKPLLYIVQKPDAKRWGTDRGIYRDSQVEVLHAFLPPAAAKLVARWHEDPAKRKELGLDHDICQQGFMREQLFGIARALFKHQDSTSTTEEEDKEERVEEAFAVLRTLALQSQIQLCSSCQTTRELRVRATSTFLMPESGKYIFCYRISIHNDGSLPVQLKGRHWEIRDEHGNVAGSVPKGSPGVIGKTPFLRPGQSFEYHSGVELPTPNGTMAGSFQMVVLDGERREDAEYGKEIESFDALVGPFLLKQSTTNASDLRSSRS